MKVWTRVEWIIVLALFVVALAVRVYRLDEIPTGLFNDEAANGLDARAILAGDHAIFFERNSGREPFFLYVQALVGSLIGLSPFALRLSAALLGALTVPTTYLMVRTLFGDRMKVAVAWAAYSAILVAFGYWHLSLSRVGFRAISLPLFMSLALIFLGRAWAKLGPDTRPPYVDAVLAGVFIGGSLYTYTAARFFPIAVGVLPVIAVILNRSSRRQVVRLGLLFGLILGVAFVVFIPLGLYFVQHPDLFFGRARDISVLATAYGASNPADALWRSTLDTLLMFWVEPDPNLRHNPAQRPVFEILLSGWLVVGVVVALRRIRLYPYLMLLGMLVVMGLPAVLTAEGTPHMLRSIGMIPVVYVLPVLGMLWAGTRLFPRRQLWALLLPLPFVLYSAVGGVGGYFQAWQNPDRFRLAFLPDYVQLGQQLSRHGDADAAWILPLSRAYFPPSYSFYTVSFFYTGEAGYAEVLVDAEAAPAQLNAAAQGRGRFYLIRPAAMQATIQAEYLLGDPKKLLPFLLRKHGTYVSTHEAPEVPVPYDVYALPPHADFALVNEWIAQSTVFDGRVKLVGADYGGIPDVAGVGERATTAGAPLWAVLQWQALEPIDLDLKVKLVLKDQAGHVIAEVDELLVGDQYPRDRTWAQGDVTETYHILATLPALAPDTYDLYVRVYEDESLRVYPIRSDDNGVIGVDAFIGSVTIAKAQTPPVVTPTYTVDDGYLTPELSLLGYDLGAQEVRPGGAVGLTLFWQATEQPQQDYTVRLALTTADGEAIDVRATAPVDGRYPTRQWAAGEIVRDIHDLVVPATADEGVYQLVLTLEGERTKEPVRRNLGTIAVSGLRRLFEPPEPAFPTRADFGEQVKLIGVDGASDLVLAPGKTVSFDLLWQVTGTPARPLVRFVQLLDAQNQVVAQQDTVPCDGMCPTSGWIVEEYLRDPVTLSLPNSLSPGAYQLVVGWYDGESFTRLPVLGAGDTVPDMFPLFTLDVNDVAE